MLKKSHDLVCHRDGLDPRKPWQLQTACSGRSSACSSGAYE
jgi:hypothetical protein